MKFYVRDLYENIIEEITFTNMIIKLLLFFFFFVVLLEDELLFLFASQEG